MSIVKRYFFLLAFVAITSQAVSQAARSPFTSLSVGEPYGNALINTQGMAGVGVSQPQFWHLNNQNPALLVYNNLTVFQAGLIAESRTVRGDTLSEKNAGGNMNYLVTAFPIKPTRWTTSVGLMPFSTLKYKIAYEGAIDNTGEPTNEWEEGKGGLTQLYWSNGVRLHKNFSVGVKAAYIFSSIVNTHTIQLAESQQPTNFPISLEEKVYVKDFSFSGGVSFSKDSLFSQNKYRLSIGAVYNFETDLNTEQRHTWYRASSVGNVVDSDTIFSDKGSIYIPSSWTAGISLSRGQKWSLGTEVSLHDWSTFRNANGFNDGLGQAWKVALGGEITPDALSENFLKRIQYRMGVSMEQLPFLVNQNPVMDRGINFGLSLPAGRSSVDLAFKYGKRGDRSENILEENYFKIYFGITFNDQWFIRQKFN